MTDYSILNPSGNITALVTTPVEIPLQPETAARIMRKHPDVEQVGFVSFEDPEKTGIHATLRMAGGEFCGNASMCAAALSVLDSPYLSAANVPGSSAALRLRVSGAADPVNVTLHKEHDSSFSAGIKMPPASDPEETAFAFHDLSGFIPCVRMDGISHMIIENDSPFATLKDRPDLAEQAVRDWCGRLNADGLGLMFLLRDSSAPSQYHLTPLVYVPSGNTIFWEHSCASGSAATAMYLAKKAGTPVSLTFVEPGGILRAESDPLSGTTYLFGNVSLTARYSSSIA